MPGMSGGLTGFPTAAPTRGTLRYNPGVGYSSGMTPDMFASDSDYNAYHAAQTAPKPGAVGTQIDPRTGQQTNYTPNPQMNTNLYSTTPSVGSINTAVGGTGSISAPAYENQQQSQLDELLAEKKAMQDADLRGKAFDTKLAALKGLGIQTTGGGNGGPQVQYDTPAFKAAQDAAFARAKDTAGQNARASLDALDNVLSEGGLRGGGYEAAGHAAVVNGAQGQMGDVIRQQLEDELGQNTHIADQNYQGGIQQRGQNLQSLQSLMSLVGGLY